MEIFKKQYKYKYSRLSIIIGKSKGIEKNRKFCMIDKRCQSLTIVDRWLTKEDTHNLSHNGTKI